MKMTNTQIESVFIAIDQLAQTATMPAGLAYRLSKMKNELNSSVEAIRQARVAVLKKLGREKEGIGPKDPMYTEAVKELTPIMEESVEVDISPITPDDLERIEGAVSLGVIDSLYPVVSDNEES